MEPAENPAGSVETKKGIVTANPSYVSGGFTPCLCIYHIMFFIYCKFLPRFFVLWNCGKSEQQITTFKTIGQEIFVLEFTGIILDSARKINQAEQKS